jgi:hypothetical protein
MSRLSLVVAAVVLMSTLLPDCVDTSALDFVPPNADAATDGPGDGGTDPICTQCLIGESGPCWDKYEACAEIPICVVVMQCLLDKACLMLPAPADRISCGLPCLEEHGVLAGNDPTVQALAQVNICALQSCTDACDGQ